MTDASKRSTENRHFCCDMNGKEAFFPQKCGHEMFSLSPKLKIPLRQKWIKGEAGPELAA
jgi:hypothetical protein